MIYLKTSPSHRLTVLTRLERKPRTAATLSLACCLAVALGCGSQESAPTGGGSGITPPPTRVLVDTASSRVLAQEVAAVGSLRSPETTTVASDVPGIIVELDAPEGREVRRGHVLAQLDGAEARAALQVAQARFDNAEIAVVRARALVADGVSAQQALDDAVAEQRTASGLLEEAKTRLEKTRIKAPFSGRVGIQTASSGSSCRLVIRSFS